jgi:hypothetical protein
MPKQIPAPHATWRSLKGADERKLDRSTGVSNIKQTFRI